MNFDDVSDHVSTERSEKMRYFGFFKGMNYDENNEKFEDYKKFHNLLEKETILKHLKSLPIDCYGMFETKDIFTGEILEPCALICDGDFTFPYDFIQYFEKYDIGIPEEYETYIRNHK
jgi:hypothetical protein